MLVHHGSTMVPIASSSEPVLAHATAHGFTSSRVLNKAGLEGILTRGKMQWSSVPSGLATAASFLTSGRLA
jgi:hypothetical protein